MVLSSWGWLRLEKPALLIIVVLLSEMSILRQLHLAKGSR